jgi:hypothetical protein
MPTPTSAPWHKQSYEQFIGAGLPQLLAERLPLTGYEVVERGAYETQVTLSLRFRTGDLRVIYTLPQPDERGVFQSSGVPIVVVPTASDSNLDTATIRCAGEQMYEYIAQLLGEAPPNLPWDEALVRTWLPLDAWMREFLELWANPGGRSGHYVVNRLDETNWLASHAHLRRLLIIDPQQLTTPGQLGRVCPFETPEGPNIGRIFSIATGAEIREGRLVIADERPEATLGLSASMIPFLEHNDPVRLLMGANMMRQWIAPAYPNQFTVFNEQLMAELRTPCDTPAEPALVQTGNEPDDPAFWRGRNLLTAFISWGGDTYEDGVVISESCARRLNVPFPAESGDKLSNRHGFKGVVSRILPDDEMPHLSDGTPVELVVNALSQHRAYFGQIREAVMGRIARVEGAPIVVPPFHAPGVDAIRERLRRAGLPEDGMEQLTRNGVPLEQRSTVGWVYWGQLVHIARAKLHTSIDTTQRQGQRLDEFEYALLREIGAVEMIREHFNTRAAGRADMSTLAARVAAGPIEQAVPSTPLFAKLARRLAVAGIRAELQQGTGDGGRGAGDGGWGAEVGEWRDLGSDAQLVFSFAPPDEPSLALAQPIAHPWARGQRIDKVGALPELPEYDALVEANTRLERMLASHAPDTLTQRAAADLEGRAREFFDALLKPEHLRFDGRVAFSGRAVVAPGPELRHDQVGVPEEMAWALFRPLAARELGRLDWDKSSVVHHETHEEHEGLKEAQQVAYESHAARDRSAEVEERTERAVQALDAVMARTWLIINRKPSFTPTAFLAFHPIRIPGHTIRLHPFACPLLDADFDGDQVAVFLPLTEAGQQEAGEKLTIAAHLTRDPSLITQLQPRHEALWGLALLSRTPKGRQEIAQLVGREVAAPDGFITRHTLADALRDALNREGVAQTLDLCERLLQRGFEVAQASGASVGPFINVGVALRGRPALRVRPLQTDDLGAWEHYIEELTAIIATRPYTPDDLGNLLLAAKSGARGALQQVQSLVGPWRLAHTVHGQVIPITHGYNDGLTLEELFALIGEARESLAQIARRWEQADTYTVESSGATTFNVLARARRAKRPGIVFVLATASSEVDPLLDAESRLFVGIG